MDKMTTATTKLTMMMTIIIIIPLIISIPLIIILRFERHQIYLKSNA